MKAVDFDYQRPAGLSETCALLAEGGGEAKIIAGGQTLVPLLVMRLARPALLIDINRIAELQGIAESGDAVEIRACTSQARALADRVVRRRLPLLAKALSFVGHAQTRNRGTIGGSLANADPAAEIGLAALALDAELSSRSARGARTIAIGQFFVSPLVTALAAEECLTAVRFPAWRADGRIGSGFQETSIRRSDFALVAAAAQLALDKSGVCTRIAISLGGAGATPVRLTAVEQALVGGKLGDGALATAEKLAQDNLDASGDIHASAAHRRRIAGALVARAVAEARDAALAEPA
ncbi:MAG TPA: FAD binding domain-containing protein [Stellaceae bacterium]|nr:FAD binding domain-containing protein [Stellaceae bacterium]